jgi:hypothetical protein
VIVVFAARRDDRRRHGGDEEDDAGEDVGHHLEVIADVFDDYLRRQD